jgi:hypothetical protein
MLDFSAGQRKGEGNGGGDGGDDKIVQAGGKDKGGQVVSVVSQIESNLPLGELLLSPSGNVLFAGVSTQGHPGRIRAYDLPLATLSNGNSNSGFGAMGGGGEADDEGNTSGIGDESNGYTEFQCHAAEITRMRCSFDGTHLFTASEDGSLCVLEIRDSGVNATGAKTKDGHKGHAKENPLAFAEEILVTKSDIEEQTSIMGDLKTKVDELTLHNEYQLRLKDINYKERIKEVTEKFTTELAQDRTRYDDLVEEKREMELEYEERLGELGLKHGAELQQVEATYTNKIHSEQGRYQQLVQERDEQNLRWDEENELMVQSHQQFLSELTADYDGQVQGEQEAQTRLGGEKSVVVTEHESMIGFVESDADNEVELVKERNEVKLNAEREATLRLKGENGIMKKKFGALQKDIEDQKEEIRSLHDKEKGLYESIKGLEKDIQGHKKEIREREETIQDKEKRIYDLKKKNQELEKFKFVLDYKIKELKRQIEPRELEISDMRMQIEEMDHELEQYHKSNAALDLMIGELRLKMDGMQAEIEGQKVTLESGASMISRFRTDLRECVQYLNDHKALKRAVTALYTKHVQDEGAAEPGSEADPQREYNRQREYLEKSVESLKRKLAKDMAMHSTENARLMRENSSLTGEINLMRRELKFMHEGKAQKEGVQQSGRPPLAPGGFDGAGGVAAPLGEEEEEQAWREAEMQQLQINELNGRLAQLHEQLGGAGAGAGAAGAGKKRPGSREHLPPM